MNNLNEYYDALERAKKAKTDTHVVQIFLDSIARSLADIGDTLSDILDLIEEEGLE